MMRFKLQSYTVEDDGIVLRFYSEDLEAGKSRYCHIRLTDRELAAAVDAAALRTLIIQKLRRKLLASEIAEKLDPFLMQEIVI